MPVLFDYSEDTFGSDFLPTEADYTDPDVQKAINAHGWMIWPLIPYSLQHHREEPADAGALAAELAQPARHRRPGARRVGAGHLRVPHVGAVRLHADRDRLGRSASRRGRCRATTAG